MVRILYQTDIRTQVPFSSCSIILGNKTYCSRTERAVFCFLEFSFFHSLNPVNPEYADSVENGKMEEDVKPEDEDGVDGRGVCGWDGWVCGLGAVGASLAFG